MTLWNCSKCRQPTTSLGKKRWERAQTGSRNIDLTAPIWEGKMLEQRLIRQSRSPNQQMWHPRLQKSGLDESCIMCCHVTVTLAQNSPYFDDLQNQQHARNSRMFIHDIWNHHRLLQLLWLCVGSGMHWTPTWFVTQLLEKTKNNRQPPLAFFFFFVNDSWSETTPRGRRMVY